MAMWLRLVQTYRRPDKNAFLNVTTLIPLEEIGHPIGRGVNPPKLLFTDGIAIDTRIIAPMIPELIINDPTYLGWIGRHNRHDGSPTLIMQTLFNAQTVRKIAHETGIQSIDFKFTRRY